MKIILGSDHAGYELKEKIKGAMMYPAVIITAMIGIGIMMLIVVVPQLARTFEELSIELPFTTKLVIGLGNFLVEKWYFFDEFPYLFTDHHRHRTRQHQQHRANQHHRKIIRKFPGQTS